MDDDDRWIKFFMINGTTYTFLMVAQSLFLLIVVGCSSNQEPIKKKSNQSAPITDKRQLIKVGMTKAQVIAVLGKPTLSTEKSNVWRYRTPEMHSETDYHRSFIIWFDNKGVLKNY